MAPSTAIRKVPSAVFARFVAPLGYACERAEKFLFGQQSHLVLWIPVALGAGIASWFVLTSPEAWTGFIITGLAIAILAWAALTRNEKHALSCRIIMTGALLAVAGCALIWTRSENIGAEPLQRPVVQAFNARIVSRTPLPAREMTRLVLDTDHASQLPRRVRVNVPAKWDQAGLRKGAIISLRARLMPPANAALPGAYNFARRAWFDGISATGTMLDMPEIRIASHRNDVIADAQSRLSQHIQRQMPGSSGAIAATLATGDRGGISDTDAEAMRRAGLAHLLSISGLHVSAVVGAIYLLVIRLLALSPSLALRYRLPLVASLAAACAGLGYTLLTGAQVPTIRACIAAMLVLTALAMGRDPLSLRLVAAGAAFVLIFWPETLVGPSFQLSFAAVTTIIALHQLPAMQRLVARRDELLAWRFARFMAMLFMTGLAIEIVLMPIALYHFHKTGIYGAIANIIAIPLTTFIIMPLEAFALTLDAVGLGRPIWALCGESLKLLLWLAHFVESRPGSIARLPSMGTATFALFVIGGIWLALIVGKARLWGLLPVAAGTMCLFLLRPPDILIQGTGGHMAVTDASGDFVLLRDRAGDYTIETLMENAGLNGRTVAMKDWKNARCSRDFCTLTVMRSGREWTVLASRSTYNVPELELAAACKRSDIVVSNRWLPRSCRPKWLKADRNMLIRTGGLSIWLDSQPRLESVAAGEGEHGWFRSNRPSVRKKPSGTKRPDQ